MSNWAPISAAEICDKQYPLDGAICIAIVRGFSTPVSGNRVVIGNARSVNSEKANMELIWHFNSTWHVNALRSLPRCDFYAVASTTDQ